MSCINCPSPEIIANEDITYFLEVRDQNGCIAIDSIKIRINESSSQIYIPNVFSPNGDNINDIWMPVLENESGLLQSVSIFDRWGNRVHHCEGSLSCMAWNGELNGLKCTPGVYVFYLEWMDKTFQLQHLKGEFSLIR